MAPPAFMPMAAAATCGTSWPKASLVVSHGLSAASLNDWMPAGLRSMIPCPALRTAPVTALGPVMSSIDVAPVVSICPAVRLTVETKPGAFGKSAMEPGLP